MGHRAGARPFTAGGSVGSITCGRAPPQQARAPVIGRRADPTLRPSHSARCHRVCSSTASSESVPPHRSFSIAFLPLPQRSRPSSYNSLRLHLASRSIPFTHRAPHHTHPTVSGSGLSSDPLTSFPAISSKLAEPWLLHWIASQYLG